MHLHIFLIFHFSIKLTCLSYVWSYVTIQLFVTIKHQLLYISYIFFKLSKMQKLQWTRSLINNNTISLYFNHAPTHAHAHAHTSHKEGTGVQVRRALTNEKRRGNSGEDRGSVDPRRRRLHRSPSMPWGYSELAWMHMHRKRERERVRE